MRPERAPILSLADSTAVGFGDKCVCGWRQIAARVGFPDVTDFLAQRLAVSLVAARGSVPEGTAIYGDLRKHRSSWRLRETSKDRQRRVYCHGIEEAAKLAVGPGTTSAEDDVVDCDLAVVICCGWNNVPKTGDKCTTTHRRSLVNLCSELQLLRHWEQDAVDMRTLLQIASGWANACSETSLLGLSP